MLADPLIVKAPSLAAASAITLLESNSFAVIDAGSGQSVRKVASPTFGAQTCANPALLKISHSVSNENKPGLTDRTLVRFDFTLVDLDGKPFNAFAYAVIGVPRGNLSASGAGSEIANSDLGVHLVQHLIGALGVLSTANTTGVANLSRILAGES